MKSLVFIALLGCFVQTGFATSGLNGLQILNGPINPVGNIFGAKTRVGQFIHPGLWHTHDDLERIILGVTHGLDPWKTASVNFSTDFFSQASFEMQGPKSIICLGPCSNYTSFTNDVRVAYQNAVMWYITKNQSQWDRSTTILDAWGSNLTNVIGTDTSLLVGLEGDMFVNAAEIMRWEGNWVEPGAQASSGSGFSNQLYWLFARQSIIIGQANYAMISIEALLSYAVYLDDLSMTGQGAEAGRDQGHVVAALGFDAGGSAYSRYNTSYLVNASAAIDKPIIVISINYRVGGWGFLASEEVVAAGELKIGLSDQRIALKYSSGYKKMYGLLAGIQRRSPSQGKVLADSA
ncbi:Lipase [Lachnellula subtilissima]|uniref:Lipase n=1 Tax=Lachnellula subtilissima TaxID=602034 RepID=A0A8H8UDS0_9HELO|nr:Lipase [Lachnellula subtilissima]